jgi:hypothetical protein
VQIRCFEGVVIEATARGRAKILCLCCSRHSLRASRAHRLGIIDDITRDNAVDTLENAIFFNNDLSFVDSDDILSLIPPTKIMRLTVRMRRELLGELSDKVSAICDEPDLDIDPEDNYQEFNSYLFSTHCDCSLTTTQTHATRFRI